MLAVGSVQGVDMSAVEWASKAELDLEAIRSHVEFNSIEAMEPGFKEGFRKACDCAKELLKNGADLALWKETLQSLPGVYFNFGEEKTREASQSALEFSPDDEEAIVKFADFNDANRENLSYLAGHFVDLQDKKVVKLDLRDQNGRNGLVAMEVMQKLFGDEFWKEIVERHEAGLCSTWRNSDKNREVILERLKVLEGQTQVYYTLLADRMSKGWLAFEDTVEMTEPDFDRPSTSASSAAASSAASLMAPSQNLLKGQVRIITDSTSSSRVLLDLVAKIKLIPGVKHEGHSLKALPPYGEACRFPLPSGLGTAWVYMKKSRYSDGRPYTAAQPVDA